MVSTPAIVTVAPTSGPIGTLIFLSGSGFTPPRTYNYRFEPGVTNSNMTACPSTYQFTATLTGGVPPMTLLTAFGQTGLVVVSDANTGQIAAYAVFTVTGSGTGPSLVLDPSSGVTGTPVTATGSGFTPGTTVSVYMSRGLVAMAKVNSAGGFTVSFVVPSSPPGAATVTASGNDITTNPGDAATTSFLVTNVGDYHSSVVPVSDTNGTLDLNETNTTDLSVIISGIPTGSLGSLRIELANLTNPSYGVVGAPFSGTVRYFDVYVVGNGTVTPGMTAYVCITNSVVGASGGIFYWNGSAWVAPSDVSISAETICGTVPVVGLSGTNFVVGNNPSTATTGTTGIVTSLPPVWPFMLVLLVGSMLILLMWLFIIAGKRRKREDEEQKRGTILRLNQLGGADRP